MQREFISAFLFYGPFQPGVKQGKYFLRDGCAARSLEDIGDIQHVDGQQLTIFEFFEHARSLLAAFTLFADSIAAGGGVEIRAPV